MTTRAIIIKKQNTNEHDQWVTCYTEDFGKLKTIAKSILKPNSIQAHHLDVFNLVEFDLINGRGMPIITGAQLIDSYMGIKNSLAKTAVAYFFAEAIDRMVFENDKDKELWSFFVSLLGKLDKEEDGFLKLFRSGQIRLLDILGYFPETDLCKACGGDLNVNNFSAFNHVLGGIVCKKCFLDGHGGILISREDFRMLTVRSVGSVRDDGNVQFQQFEHSEAKSDSVKRSNKQSDPTFRRSILDGMFENIYGNKFYSLDLINVVK